jgi:hypothetical protein
MGVFMPDNTNAQQPAGNAGSQTVAQHAPASSPAPAQQGAGASSQTLADEYNAMNPINKAILWAAGLIGSAYVLFNFAPTHINYRAPKPAVVEQAVARSPCSRGIYSIDKENKICFDDGLVFRCEDAETADATAMRLDAIISCAPKTNTNKDKARLARIGIYEAIKDGVIYRSEMGLQPLAAAVKAPKPRKFRFTDN